LFLIYLFLTYDFYPLTSSPHKQGKSLTAMLPKIWLAGVFNLGIGSPRVDPRHKITTKNHDKKLLQKTSKPEVFAYL